MLCYGSPRRLIYHWNIYIYMVLFPIFSLLSLMESNYTYLRTLDITSQNTENLLNYCQLFFSLFFIKTVYFLLIYSQAYHGNHVFYHRWRHMYYILLCSVVEFPLGYFLQFPFLFWDPQSTYPLWPYFTWSS